MSEKNPLYSSYREPGSPEGDSKEYQEQRRVNAKDVLPSTFPHSILARRVAEQLNDSSLLTDEQLKVVREYIESNDRVDINSEEGRQAIGHLVEFISTRR